MIKDWPWQPHQNLDSYLDSRDRITTGPANTNDENDPNHQKTEDKIHKTQDALQDKEDNSKKKQKHRQTNCPHMKTKYQIFSNTNDNRKILTPKTLIFPKKLLILIFFMFFLPSTLPRCITLPENTITAKGRKARVRFSSTDCSIQKINVPLRLQEKSAGLIPLKFKVYEYGTKPEEYATLTSARPTLPAISDPKPELEGSVEPGKGPLPELDVTTGTGNNNPDITTKAVSNDQAAGNNPDITAVEPVDLVPGNDPEITSEAAGNDPEIITGTVDNDPDPKPAVPVPGNDPEAVENDQATGNNPDIITADNDNDPNLDPDPKPSVPVPGNDPEVAENDQATGNNPAITTGTADNGPNLDPEPKPAVPGPGNDPDITSEAVGNHPYISADSNNQDLFTEAADNNPDSNGPDITSEAASNDQTDGNNLDITTETEGNNPDLDPDPDTAFPVPGNDPDSPGNVPGIHTEPAGNNPDITTDVATNDLDTSTEAVGNNLDKTTGAIGNNLDITTGAIGNDPDISSEAAGPDITSKAPGNDPDISTAASGNNLDVTTEAVGNDLSITTETADNVPYITTEAANNDLSSFQVENIISYVTEVELPSGEGFDEQDGIDDGIEHQSNGPDEVLTTDNDAGNVESNLESTSAEDAEEGGVTSQSDEASFTSIQAYHTGEEGTTSQLDGHSGEVEDQTLGEELGRTTSGVTGSDDTLQSEVTGGGAEEHGDAGGTEATSTQSIVTEDIPSESDEEIGDITQPVNEGVVSPVDNAVTSDQYEEVSRQPSGTMEETNPKEEGTIDGYPMPTQSVTNQQTGANDASLQLSGSTEQIDEESESAAISTRYPDPDDAAMATTQPVQPDLVGEDGGIAGPVGLEEELTTVGQPSPGEEVVASEEERSSTRQSQTTALSSGVQEEEITEEHSESDEDLKTTLEPGGIIEDNGRTEFTEEANNNDTPTHQADSTQEEGFSVTSLSREPEGGNTNADESATGQYIEVLDSVSSDASTTFGVSMDTSHEVVLDSGTEEEASSVTNGGSSEQSIGEELTIESGSTEQPGNADPVGGLADTEDAVVDIEVANDQDYVEISTTTTIDFETVVNSAKTSTTNEMSTKKEQVLTTIQTARDSTESSTMDDMDAEEPTITDPTSGSPQPNLSTGHSSGSTSTYLKATSPGDETSAIESTLGVNETPLQSNAFLPTSTNSFESPTNLDYTNFLDSGSEATVSNQPSGQEASVAGQDDTSVADVIATTKAFSSSADEEVFTKSTTKEDADVFSPDPTTAQILASKSETYSQPNVLTTSKSALLSADAASLETSPQSGLTFGNAGTTSQNSAETSSKSEYDGDSSKPTTQASGEPGSSLAGEPTNVGTVSMHASDVTSLPNLSNAGNPSQAMATSSAAEFSTTGHEEAEPVINLKTVGSNILSGTVNIEDGGNDLTTRQLTLFTGSTKDNMTPDQTRRNDLQDLTTKHMSSTMDILTQDSTQTYDNDKETVRIHTTTDNSLSEGQAPELNPSSPGSQTNVNTNTNNLGGTNPNNLGGTKHPLSTQYEGQTMSFTIDESNSEEISRGPTKTTWTDTTLDSGNTIEIDANQQPSTPEPDMELNLNLAQDLTPDSVSSSTTSTTPCICPATTTTSLGTTGGTTTGTTTSSGDCLCPDIILGPAEVETATDLPVTSGGRRRREWDDDDLYVDDFDQKILKKMPFLKFY